MNNNDEMEMLSKEYIKTGDHSRSDYFGLIKELVRRRNRYDKEKPEYKVWQKQIDRIYELVRDELISNRNKPTTPVKFGTSGWRGIIGKDIYVKSVSQVTRAIVAMYREVERDAELPEKHP